MKCVKSDKKSIQLCIELLKKGKIVILPTDTVYGFSAIVSDQFETDKIIRQIKGREETKPFIQLIAKPEDISLYSDDKIPSSLLKYWPGPLTIIVNDKRLINSKNKTTAFRCPGDLWLRQIIEKTGYPLYSTSVNRSGSPVLDTETAILDEFENETDLIVLDGDKKNSLPSTIVKIDNGNVVVLRQGALKIDL